MGRCSLRCDHEPAESASAIPLRFLLKFLLEWLAWLPSVVDCNLDMQAELPLPSDQWLLVMMFVIGTEK